MSDVVRIAIVQALDGHLTCVGPNDFTEKDHGDAMSAAISWHLEAGHLPAATYWVEAELPSIPTVPELRAKALEGTFPKSFIDEMDERLSLEAAASHEPAGTTPTLIG